MCTGKRGPGQLQCNVTEANTKVLADATLGNSICFSIQLIYSQLNKDLRQAHFEVCFLSLIIPGAIIFCVLA
jgi:hypothetical protein